MSKFLQFLIISIVLLGTCVGAICACFSLNSTSSFVIIILLSISLFVGFLYCFMFSLSFKVGKKQKATITNKQFIPTDNEKHNANARYKYTYQITINNRIKTGSFKVFCLDNDIITNLNIGDEIEVNKFLFVISVDVDKIKANIRSLYQNDEVLKNQKSRKNRILKRDLIVGISILIVVAICCLIYVFTI